MFVIERVIQFCTRVVFMIQRIQQRDEYQSCLALDWHKENPVIHVMEKCVVLVKSPIEMLKVRDRFED
jgi:hypothetical protein